jgi:hypothetical protein
MRCKSCSSWSGLKLHFIIAIVDMVSDELPTWDPRSGVQVCGVLAIALIVPKFNAYKVENIGRGCSLKSGSTARRFETDEGINRQIDVVGVFDA